MMDRPHFEHRVFSASVSWTQSLLISPVLSTYRVPDLAPVVLSGGSGVVSVFLVGKQTQARAKLGSSGEKPIQPLVSSVHCTESFGVWSNASLFWQATFPRFPEM